MNPAFAGGGVPTFGPRPQFMPRFATLGPGGTTSTQLAQTPAPQTNTAPAASAGGSGWQYATPDYGIPPSLASPAPPGFYDPTPVFLNFNASMGGGPDSYYEGGRYDENGVFRDVWSNQSNNFNRPRQPYTPTPHPGVPIFGGGGR